MHIYIYDKDLERSETICINKYENWEAVLIFGL